MVTNSKGLLKRKVVYLETALLESESVVQGLLTEIEKLQKVIESYKASDDPKDLEQNNDMVLDLIKLRLDKGARDYHRQIPIIPADDINRDNFYEAVEESLDLSVYLAAYMLRLMEEKERREFEPTTADEYNKPNLKKYGPAYSAALSTSIDKEESLREANDGQEEAKKESTA